MEEVEFEFVGVSESALGEGVVVDHITDEFPLVSKYRDVPEEELEL